MLNTAKIMLTTSKLFDITQHFEHLAKKCVLQLLYMPSITKNMNIRLFIRLKVIFFCHE